MPHLFLNRPRNFDLTAKPATRGKELLWESVNAAFYKIGGLIFIFGSVLFFPAFEAYEDVGAWLFVVGSLFYLLVTGHDLIEVINARRRRSGPPGLWDRLEAAAALTYVGGTLLFIVGSLCFLKRFGAEEAGATCFVVGSLLFVAGAVVNVLQIVTAGSLIKLQLMNLTAISFVTGSVLFAVASVPYLWTVKNSADARELYAYLALLYVIGSVLFLLGGIFNYWRALLVIRGVSRLRDLLRASR
ncbi:YrhK family protein [Roseibium sp. Sym1]|uniref:YrhK family protein n=1 Tax=Roseibium sp. Sym1 TaxID=3016006 RepID=UPI0022B49EAA|nr:YrhK family protein [Roseibium sp. Sym1]